MSFIDHFETQLVDAGRRRIERRWRNRAARWLRVPRRRNAAVVFAALLVAAPATAATVGWNPFDGPERNPGVPSPSASDSTPARQLTSMLAPLRREQTSADRGPATSLAARDFWDDVSGVQLDYIRRVQGPAGVVLVPVARFGLRLERAAGRPLPNPADFRDAVCLYTPSAPGTAVRPCYTAARIRSGFAIGSQGGTVVGLVPDGVAAVRLHGGDRPVEVPVRDNVFVAGPPAPTNPAGVDWLDARGATVKRTDLTSGAGP